MIKKSDQSVNDGIVMLIFLTVILTGIHGLVSLGFLMLISRMSIGRDPEDKHGVSYGASRLGGLAVIFSLFSGLGLNIYISETSIIKNLNDQYTAILIFSILIGLVGLVEDFRQNLSSSLRLLLMMLIIVLSFIVMPDLLPYELKLFLHIDEPIKLSFIYFFTTVMVAGFINAGNIADGANGLLSLLYLAFFYCLNIIEPSALNLSMIVSLLIFVIYNLGTGRVFLGDFGAYFLSAFVAYSCLKTYQKHDISIFFFASILIYPCFEITRSLVFRLLAKSSVMSPDNNHLHNKLNCYLLSYGLNSHQSNSMTGVFLAFISSAFPTYLFIIGISSSSNIWFILFIFQFIILCSIYLLLGKIILKIL